MAANSARSGGYDDGYRACPCFWGSEPGSLVIAIDELIDWATTKVLDLGCGEGKNSIWIAKKGSMVDAVDISKDAISNALQVDHAELVNFVCDDIVELNWKIPDYYGLAIAYGLFHCLTEPEIKQTAAAMIASLTPGGYLIIVAFNARSQDIDTAHPGFQPTLLRHTEYLTMFKNIDLIHESDTDLHESHPHNNIPHTHSMTRLILQKPHALTNA